MNITDTHCHLLSSPLYENLDNIIERAKSRGIDKFVVVTENFEESIKALELSERYKGVIFAAAGLFPTNLDLLEALKIADFIKKNRKKIVAIGEVGLDHWKIKDEKERKLQREIFEIFVELAIELNLPLNIHSRSAGKVTIELLIAKGAEKVQMHAFDGSFSSAKKGIDAGFFFSVPPSIVRSNQKQKLFRRMPIENILLESDAPALAPEAGDINEPANILFALEYLGYLKKLEIEEMVAKISKNTQKLYGELNADI